MTRSKLDYVHSNLWGLYRVPSKSDVKYFITLINDYAWNILMYFL